MGFTAAARPPGLPEVMPMFYVVPAVLIVVLYILYRHLLPKPLPNIAYNATSAASLLGDAPDMARTVRTTGEFGPWCAAQVAKAGAPLCQIFVRPFSRPWVLLSDYREAHDILGRRTAPGRDVDFDKSTFITHSFSCLGDFLAGMRASGDGGDRLKRRRALIQDLMAPHFLHGVVGPAVHGKGMELVRLLEAKMRLAGGRPFTVKEELDRVALDVMLYFAFGEKFDESCLGPQMGLVSRLTASDVPDVHVDEPVEFPEAPPGAFIDAVRSVPRLVERYITSVVPRLNLWWWKKQPWYKKTFSVKDQVFREQTRKALEDYRAGEVRSAVQHMMMREEREAEKQGCKPELENDALADELFGQILAGSHTTGGALGWLVKYITKYPHIQTKLRDHLYAALPQAVADGRPPTFEELRRARLPYLDAFIEESLRLNPVPVTREAIHNTTVLGRPIPKGCIIFLISNGPGFLSPSLDVSASERSPAARAAKLNDHWGEAQDLRAFDPERWLVRSGHDDADVEFHGAAGPQLAFSHGVRGCWGKRLAQMEMRTILALLVWHFTMLDIPEALAGYGATEEGIARRPRKVFVRLKKVVQTGSTAM